MHARAMEAPARASVEAPFGGETATFHGTTYAFSQRGGAFTVRADGLDGQPHDFQVAFTFGVAPLQQYLLPLPGGRLQALGVAWDARPAPEGARWFHLHPEQPLHAGDVLHWTSRSQSWNRMCADCHSTNLRKGYVAAEDRYETTWSDLSVACEACHGPGSRHVAWARGRGGAGPRRPGEDDGLVALGARDGATWRLDPATGIAHRDRPRSSRAEVETCARCHARRAQLTDGHQAGRPLADGYRPALLDEGLYFADGQIQDEVYEYGSFLQSRMYAMGVTCSDCHDPHRPEIAAAPDAVCARCHQPARFARAEHHHHAQGSPGSSCVACHMPARTYMEIDTRRDHGFRVPRPDLTVALGTPNACAACHADRPAAWAAKEVRAWRGGAPPPRHYAEAIAAGRTAAADAAPRLLAAVQDPAIPAIVRATAVSLLARWLDARSAPVVAQALQDPDPLVRLAAVDVLSGLPEPQRIAALGPRLGDPARAVRIQAARALATVPEAALPEAERALRARGVAEWEAAQRFNGDAAAGHVNLARLHAERGELERARQEVATARRLEPYFAPAALAQADLARAEGRDDEAVRVLREALTRTPEVSALHRALGLALVRQRRMPEALEALSRAAALAPGDGDAQYVLAVALYSAGRQAEALALLERTWRARPGDRAVLSALAAYTLERGDRDRAEALAVRLVELSPDDPDAAALLARVRAER